LSRNLAADAQLWLGPHRGRLPTWNDIGATTYGSIKSILQHGLDRAYANDKPPDEPPIQHGNIRGTDYYH
jgi:hypothetical protein